MTLTIAPQASGGRGKRRRNRHCEERSDEAIQEGWTGAFHPVPLDCFAALAMTESVDRSQTLPTVFSRTRGWISACDSTGVSRRKRSMIWRAKGRAIAEVTSAGISPMRAASSNLSRT